MLILLLVGQFGIASVSAHAEVYDEPVADAVQKALLKSETDAEKSDSGSFSGYEIRVIYPKYVQKRDRMELSGQMTVVMNQTFIYTLMLSGLLDYHFSEMFALELNASFGFSIDKEDKRVLDDEFEIKTQILKTKYIVGLGILWTPIYGKSQMPSGKLIYFDSYIYLGLGMTGIAYDFEQCQIPDDPDLAADVAEPPAPVTKNYPTGVIGLGQKYFVNRETAIRWDVRDHLFSYDAANDGTCLPPPSSGIEARDPANKLHQNVTFSIGASTLF